MYAGWLSLVRKLMGGSSWSLVGKGSCSCARCGVADNDSSGPNTVACGIAGNNSGCPDTVACDVAGNDGCPDMVACVITGNDSTDREPVNA